MFIGEVKYDAEDVYQKMKAGQRGSGKGKKQWPALINHAKDFSWSRTVLFTSFRGLERHKRREVVRAARKNQVLVVFVSVLRSRR